MDTCLATLAEAEGEFWDVLKLGLQAVLIHSTGVRGIKPWSSATLLSSRLGPLPFCQNLHFRISFPLSVLAMCPYWLFTVCDG